MNEELLRQLMMWMQTRSLMGRNPLEDDARMYRPPLTEDAPLPPRDPHLLAPGQYGPGGRSGQQLHPNAFGIYGGYRPPPPGDEVLPATGPQAPPGLVPPQWTAQPYAPYGGMPLVGDNDSRRANELKRLFRGDGVEFPGGAEALRIGWPWR